MSERSSSSIVALFMDRYRQWSRTMQIAFWIAVVLIAYFGVIEPAWTWTTRFNEQSRQLVDRIRTLESGTSDERATIRQGHGFWGDRPLQRSGAGESMTLQKALTSVLEANDIQAGVSIKDIGIDDVQLGDDRTRGGRGSAGREASAQLAIRKNKTQVQFRARPDVLSAVLADLEQNPNVACIQRMTIRRDSNSTMLDVTLVAQSWQTR